MTEHRNKEELKLADHFFRTEYGKMVSVITRHLGVGSIETAEDIVQETLFKAVNHWQQQGIPPNPQGWLYKTAKNLTLNILKRRKYESSFRKENADQTTNQIEFSENSIEDEQLRMMLVCCHPSVSEETQIALILKVLCGFSILEIASAFFTSKETINKRLVRGRKQLRQEEMSLDALLKEDEPLKVVLKAIYLLFNEGYSPARQEDLIRFDLCLEAMRLIEILIKHEAIQDKGSIYALSSLMYLNASRFEARINDEHEIVEMEKQDRGRWNAHMISYGVEHLNAAIQYDSVSRYLILANISAYHCIAENFEKTDWQAILNLYDDLMEIEDSVNTRLNRSIALFKVKGPSVAIEELLQIESSSDIDKHYLFHATMAELYDADHNIAKSLEHLKKALSLTDNERVCKSLRKKISDAVPF